MRLNAIIIIAVHGGHRTLDKMLRRSMLFDYYGDLLNKKQRAVYEDTVLNDMSLNEIAEAQGTTKQAVSEVLKRCDERLEQYENCLGLIEKEEKIRKSLDGIRNVALSMSPEQRIRLDELAESIIKEL